MTRDNSGNVTKKEIKPEYGNAFSVTYTASYTKDGRVTAIKDGYGAVFNTFSYDNKKRLTACTKNNEQFGYDAKNRTISRSVTAQGVTKTYAHTYDDVTGRLTKTTVDGLEIMPKYDFLNRNAGKEVKLSSAAFVGEKLSYLKVGDHATALPAAVTYSKNGVTSDKLSYAYDEMGNIREIRENGALKARYAYDALGRLIREDNKSFGKTTVFAYDTCGNILSKREYAFTLKEADEPEEMACTERLYAYDGDRLMPLPFSLWACSPTSTAPSLSSC